MMQCDKCGKHQATVHIETVVNGVKKQRNLCSECAKEENAFHGFTFNIGDILSEMFAGAEQPVHSMAKCSKCGMTVSDFERIGKLGCANCYKDLRQEIMPVLKRIHGSTHHSGFMPEETDKTRLAIQGLKARLSEAILQENFEEAAKLRDEIRALEEGEKHDSVD